MSKGINDDFAEWVVERMRRAGVETQAELARLVGVTDSTVSRWIVRGATPDRDQMRALAKALKVTVPEALVAAGFMTREEAKIREVLVTPDPQPVPYDPDGTFAALPEEDQQLIRDQVSALAQRLKEARGL